MKKVKQIGGNILGSPDRARTYDQAVNNCPNIASQR